MSAADGTNRTPHILYVCWGFPPCRGSGVFRGLATANALADEGFAVTVITADRETFLRNTGADTSLETRVRDDITVVRVPFQWPSNEEELLLWTEDRVKDPAEWLRQWNAACLETFPENRYGAWAPAIIAAAEQVHATTPIDLVICTANPNVACVVGEALHRIHGIPHIVDQRDAWTLNVLTDLVDFPDGTPVAKAERAFIESAAECWYVNEPIRRWYANNYPDHAAKMYVVMNGYDEEFAPTPHRERPPGVGVAREGLTFGYVGTISAAVPLAETFDAWLEARESSPLLARSRAEFWGHLGFFTREEVRLHALFQAATDWDVDYRGPVGKTQIAEVYGSFDVLLFLAARGKYVTSGKVFEYMATGLPIVSAHEPDIAARDVLQGYPLWFQPTDLSPGALSEAMIAAGEAALTTDPVVRQACIDHARQFERSRQLVAPLARLHGLVERHRESQSLRGAR